MTTDYNKVSIRQGHPEKDRTSITRILSADIPDAVSNGRYDWAYLDNPDGLAHVWMAETQNGEVIGTSAGFPRRFRMAGETLQGIVLSDFAISKKYRTLGPAVALLRATLKAVDDGIFNFALDYPSESMLAVYRRLGALELGKVNRYVRLLRMKGAAERRYGKGPLASLVGASGDAIIGTLDRFKKVPRSVRVETGRVTFGEDHDRLSRLLESRCKVVGERSARYLNWRYHGGARFESTVVAIRSGAELLGFGVLQNMAANSMTISEFVCPQDQGMEEVLFNAMLREARGRGAEALQATGFDGGPWATVLERLGFVRRETLTGPVVYSPRDESWTAALHDKDNWWMTDGDRDG